MFYVLNLNWNLTYFNMELSDYENESEHFVSSPEVIC